MTHRPYLDRVRRQVNDLLALGHYPVRGGAEADDEATDEDTIEVAGDRISRKDWEDFKNNQNWRRANDERSASIKAEREELEHQRALTREEQRALAAERARLAEERGAPKEDEGEPLPDYPESLIDEPDKLLIAMKAREAAQERELRELRQQVGKLQTSLTDTTRSVETKVNSTIEYERVVGENKRLFDEYLKENPDITTAEKDAMFKELQYRSRNPDRHGKQVGAAWAYTRQALEDADWVVRKDRHRARIQEEAENRALRGPRPRSNGGFRLGSSGVPGPDDPVEKLAEYYYGLGENSPEAAQFTEALGQKDPRKLLEVMRYATDQAFEELGGVSASR